MQPSEQDAFGQLLTGIGLLYGKTLHEAVLAIWWQALKHCEFSEVRAALNAHVVNPDNGQFMPKPADVMAYVQGSTESQALQAWTHVAEAIRDFGAYHSVIFPDPLIHRVIRDMGGWIALCQSKTSELPFVAKEFEKRYRVLVIHPPADYPRQLTGLVEQQNRLGGYSPPDPVLTGNTHQPTLLETSCVK
jgi:hypothetical protein